MIVLNYLVNLVLTNCSHFCSKQDALLEKWKEDIEWIKKYINYLSASVSALRPYLILLIQYIHKNSNWNWRSGNVRWIRERRLRLNSERYREALPIFSFYFKLRFRTFQKHVAELIFIQRNLRYLIPKLTIKNRF